MLNPIPMQTWYLADVNTYGLGKKACTEFYGVEKQESEQKKFNAILSKEEAELFSAENKQVFKTKKLIKTKDWVKNGKIVFCLLAITWIPIFDRDVNEEYKVCSGEDISEQKQEEEAPNKSKDKFQMFNKKLEEGVLLEDTEGFIFFVNPRITEILGYPKDKISLLNEKRKFFFKELIE